jgi:hypothetical protein
VVESRRGDHCCRLAPAGPRLFCNVRGAVSSVAVFANAAAVILLLVHSYSAGGTVSSVAVIAAAAAALLLLILASTVVHGALSCWSLS